MDLILLATLSTLPEFQKVALKKGSILNVTDLVLTPPNEIARKCKISLLEAKGIVDLVCKENSHCVRQLEDAKREGDEKCTTGDTNLDDALGGGIRTGMIWEVVGESSSGKTQLALQLSLLVQLPKKLGGLSGSACYLTTSSKLPTSRLVQISETHPLLSPSLCGLSDIHTLATPTVPILIHVLSKILPSFINNRSNDFHSKPVKFLVIDALAELFHLNSKTTTSTLVERSHNISEISTLLHTLASTHQLAVLVLNEVVDAFDRGRETDVGDSGDLVYSDQSRWFNRADSVPGENRKEASLGLVWANQVNARILLSRTGRRRYLEETESRNGKHRKIQSHQNPISSPGDQPALVGDQATQIRRLSIIFSSVSPPVSLDYTVMVEGISILPPDGPSPLGVQRPASSIQRRPSVAKLLAAIPDARPVEISSQISPLDVGVAEDGRKMLEETVEGSAEAEPEQDEWETYWNAGEIPEDLYNNVDCDALEPANIEPPP